MDIKDAKSLVIKLTNAAYEAGLWKDHINKTMAPYWREKAEEIGDEIVRHLSAASTRPDIAECNCHPYYTNHGRHSIKCPLYKSGG